MVDIECKLLLPMCIRLTSSNLVYCMHDIVYLYVSKTVNCGKISAKLTFGEEEGLILN